MYLCLRISGENKAFLANICVKVDLLSTQAILLEFSALKLKRHYLYENLHQPCQNVFIK